MRKKLYIVRREAGGIGGAEKVANKFVKAFSPYFDTELISAGRKINGFQIRGVRGPSWMKCIQFAKSSNQFINQKTNALVLSMERGVPGSIYRAGDGVHKVWIKHKYGSSKKWVFNPLHWVLPLLEKKSIQKSLVIVANSKMVMQQILDNYDVTTEKLKVIYNGYDTNIYHPLNTESRESLRQKLGIHNNSLNFLFAGSGWDRKGLEWAIRLQAELKNSGKESFLWIAGKGNQIKYKRVARKHNVLGHIKFLGSVQRINQWYQVADYMILPTALDPFSNSCLESLACGCPIITTRMNGASELVKERNNGFVIEKNSEKAIKELATIICEHCLIKPQNISEGTMKYPNLDGEIDNYVKTLRKIEKVILKE